MGPRPWGNRELQAAYPVGEGRLAVVLTAKRHGRDLLVSLGGGESHVGAVAVVSPAGGTRGESYEGDLLVPGHKEGPLAREFATRLAEHTGRTCTVVVGIHIDDATPEEIEGLVAHAREALSALIEDL